ncbi:MAG: Alkaline phosphatase [Solirubrobacterales bacterium]|nr:Alkaline phosphatase [Solirubrobacterales bacterium]
MRRVPRGRATLLLRVPSKLAQRVRPGRRYVVTLRARDRHGRSLGPLLRAPLAILAPPPAAPPPAPPPPPPPPPAPPPPPPDPVVAAAGDISCPSPCAQVGTAALVTDVIKPVAVLGLGDFQYPDADPGLYSSFYDPTWGRFKAITYTTPGNHDAYGTGPYLTYFNAGGPVALQPESLYSFDIGTWHVVSLDSYCFERTTCDEQAWGAWLQRDLAAHPAKCTLAFFHQPYWTTPGDEARTAILKPWIKLLYDAGADLVLEAHEHFYERFAPQDPDDRPDPARGIASFVVGTGGASHTAFSGPPAANSVVRDATTFGVLSLTLHPAGYDFRFVPVPGGSFTDAGSGTCH